MDPWLWLTKGLGGVAVMGEDFLADTNGPPVTQEGLDQLGHNIRRLQRLEAAMRARQGDSGRAMPLQQNDVGHQTIAR